MSIFDVFGVDMLLRLLMVPVEWMPAPCYMALDLIVRVFWIVILGRVLKFIWDALPVA